MITFKQQITVPEELVQGIAVELGWEEELEITPEQFVDLKAKEHTARFFLPFGQKLVEQQLATAKAQLEQAIIVPVKEALITEVVHSEDN